MAISVSLAPLQSTVQYELPGCGSGRVGGGGGGGSLNFSEIHFLISPGESEN